MLPTPVFLCFPCGSAAKEFTCNAGDLGLIPGLGRFPWRKEQLPTPVFRPEVHGLYSPWNHKQSDMPERLSLHSLLKDVPNMKGCGPLSATSCIASLG